MLCARRGRGQAAGRAGWPAFWRGGSRLASIVSLGLALGSSTPRGAAQSVVAEDFACTLPRLHAALVSAIPLANGGVILRRSTYGGVGRYDILDRLTAAGAADPAWPRYAYAMGMEPAGTVLAVLRDGTFFMSQAPYRRYSDGTVVSSFSLGIALEAGGDLVLVTLQSDGKLLIAQGSRLARVTATGARDAGFVASGVFLDSIAQLAVDSRGRVLVSSHDTAQTRWRLDRLTAGGAIDPAFTPVVAGEAMPFTLLADDSLVLARMAPSGASSYEHYLVDGTWGEAWDLGRWIDARSLASRGALVIAPDRHVYVTYAGLVYRLSGGATCTLDPDFFAVADGPVYHLALEGTRLYLAGDFGMIDGIATADIGCLDTTKRATATAPMVKMGPVPDQPRAGDRVVVQGAAVGTGEMGFRWTSLDGGQLPADANSPTLCFDSFGAANLGRYQLWVNGPFGLTLSDVVDLRSKDTARLTNLSGRAQVGTGEEIAIAGFIVSQPAGGPAIHVVLRGVGPGLAPLGVTHPLRNPQLSLRDATGAESDANDDWEDSPYTRNWMGQAGAFAIASGSTDALLVKFVPAGSSTLLLTAPVGDQAVGLAEIYDAAPDGPMPRAELMNLSLRGHVGSGEATLIAGFTVTDAPGFGRKAKVLIRAVGPSLSRYGVRNPVADPKLTVFGADREPIAANDDWSNSPAAGDVIRCTAAVGTFGLAPGSPEAAVVLDLAPGAYTVQANPARGAEGVGMIELYRIP